MIEYSHYVGDNMGTVVLNTEKHLIYRKPPYSISTKNHTYIGLWVKPKIGVILHEISVPRT